VLLHLRAAGPRLIGVLVAFGSVVGLFRLARRAPRRRPSADEIMRMHDSALVGFVRSKGLRTAIDLEATVSAAD
jgi:hypothetical protein